MPSHEIDGATLHYTDDGAGEETLFFSHGLLMSGRMFEPQIAHFSPRYRCVTHDHRGQGRSAVAASGYDMDTLTGDAIALIEKLGAAPVHFAGLSMGGFIGMRIAARRPDLIRSLILIETAAGPEPAETQRKYRLLNFFARWLGLRAVIGKVMPIMFGRTFLTDPYRGEERARWRREILAGDRIGITRAVTGVTDRAGVEGELPAITAPTLVIVGEEDVATPPEKAERIVAGIAGARLARIPGAGHSSTIEAPEAVNAAIEEFLASLA